MKKFFKYALILLGVDVLLFLLLALKPIPEPQSKAENLHVSGVVETISKSETGGLMLTICEDARTYQIDRLGTTPIESVEKWVELLSGQQVMLYYSNAWTPIDQASNTRQLSALEIDGKKIWVEQ